MVQAGQDGPFEIGVVFLFIGHKGFEGIISVMPMYPEDNTVASNSETLTYLVSPYSLLRSSR